MSSHPRSGLHPNVALSPDAAIDALLPDAVGRVAGLFWTPVVVAHRVGSLLDELGVRRVLDVGSGPGKFCVLAGPKAPRASFVGIEHRPHLVEVARSLTARLGVRNVAFEVGDATTASWSEFDAFYVFNSFAENEFSILDRFDATVELSRRRRITDLLRVERCLTSARDGSVLVTYHGLGGPIPAAYEPVHVEAAGTGWLRVWRKGTPPKEPMYWVEDGDDVYVMTPAQVRTFLLGMRLEDVVDP